MARQAGLVVANVASLLVIMVRGIALHVHGANLAGNYK